MSGRGFTPIPFKPHNNPTSFPQLFARSPHLLLQDISPAGNVKFNQLSMRRARSRKRSTPTESARAASQAATDAARAARPSRGKERKNNGSGVQVTRAPNRGCAMDWILNFSWNTFELSITRTAAPNDRYCSALLLFRPTINNVNDYRRRS